MRARPIFEFRIAGRRIRLGERTLIVGVVNVTPDSFSDGGFYLDPAKAVKRGLELVRQGADWIDVGGESTRPGSEPVSEAEELRRVVPVVEALRRALDHPAPGVKPATGSSFRVNRRVEISIESGRFFVLLRR